MIPMIVEFRYRRRSGRTFRFWFPLFVVWLLVLPLLILVMPLFLLACLVTWLNPVRVMGVFWGIAGGLRGTHIEVDDPSGLYYISLR